MGTISLILYVPSFVIMTEQTDTLGNIVSISYTLAVIFIPFIVGLFLLKKYRMSTAHDHS